MKITDPKIEERREQPYMGIRTEATMKELPKVIPDLLEEVFDWLNQHGLAPAGPPLIRYYVIDMAAQMDIELGVPVSHAVPGDSRVTPRVIPAGRYASLVYTGVKNGIQGNGALIDWAAQKGIQWDRWDDEKGDAFGGRFEFFLDGPQDDPDPANWRTEVAFRVAE